MGLKDTSDQTKLKIVILPGDLPEVENYTEICGMIHICKKKKKGTSNTQKFHLRKMQYY